MNGISMQVGLHTSTLSNAGATVSSPALNRSAPVSGKTVVAHSEYPASPLLTTRPQRYSVQLNDQLTTLQHADSYLGQLEQSLLDYRHAAGRRSADLQKQAADVVQLLDKRTGLSGGAVDRQLAPVLQGEAKVLFHAPALAQALSVPQTLLFSVQDGQKKRLSAVSADENSDARQHAMQMNNALRRVGIETRPQQGETLFATDEKQFAQLAATLTQKSAGKNPQAVAVTAEPAQADRLRAAVASGNGAQSLVQTTLAQLGDQRQQLAVQQEKARQLIDGMARFPESQSAVDASTALSSMLDRASHNYEVLAQAVSGQANLSKMTVRSLLR